MQYPCGFCGQSSINGACQLCIVSGKAISSCAHSYDFRISSASKISKQKPCTNVPIMCKFCHDVHWKHNMRHHLQEWHPSWESMHMTCGDHILSHTSTTHMVNLLADLTTQCQFSIPTSHLCPSPCQFLNSSGLQYSVTTMMSSLDSVVISLYFFACVTYIVQSHS
jgi:hypothetical protein